MNPFEFGTESGVLRVEFTGAWTPQNFAKLLNDLYDLYRRLNTLEFFDQAIAAEKSENERFYRNQQYDRRSFTFEYLFHGNPYEHRDEISRIRPTFEVLISTAEQFSGEPPLKSVHYSSPGWVEMIGSWNPLKLIADAIAEWRKQNTEREKIRVESNLEEMRIRAGVLSTLLNKDNLLGSGDPRTYELVLDKFLNPATQFVTGLATDSRILSVKALSHGEAAELETKVIKARRNKRKRRG